MSKERYNNQTITQYLLGALPEAEAEAFDELSLTDDEFADSLKAAENDLVDAYVQGELGGAVRQRFQSNYLASPIRREKVKFARAFQTFAETNAAPQTLKVEAENLEAGKKRKNSRWLSALGIDGQPRRALQYGFAGIALALLLAGGWLAFYNMRLHQQVSQTEMRQKMLRQREQELRNELEGERTARAATEQELARVREEREQLKKELKQGQQQIVEQQRAARHSKPPLLGASNVASFILTPQMRSAGQMQTISVPAQAAYVAMQLQLEPNDYQAFTVTLLDESNKQTLWRSGTLKARTTGDNKSLRVGFRAALLKPQTYLLRVNGVAASSASENFIDYPFKVVK